MKAFKRKYNAVQAQGDLGKINTHLLCALLFYCQNIVQDHTDSCEGDPFIKKDSERRRYEITLYI